ncbi:cytochrome c oxidase assembly protein [Vibrio sp. SCSIO 43137]|uniref:cytochrome c oxidase assembly protein n=1 Tax=Vibrio sp. SCSIO 43137 TaxID=3021011 RepID=UPI002306F352|nr:cytochrome c oxidase assembly protein [Vibrio sp. SCSIO 43137]WCE31292.1 cytochrome c oxidase assembly protein [Vibrio sp. SCSIO 43137]
MDTQQQANRKLTLKLLAATLAMFGFGFALVPLYDVMCDVLGINGKTNTVAAIQPATMIPDSSRSIKVELMSHIPPGMSWQLEPEKSVMQVHPGQVVQTSYKATNLSQRELVGQAVPSVSPGLGAGYFNKMECFCFNQQTLKAGESAELGLVFYIEPDIPDSIHTLTLSYTLFDITETAKTSSGNMAVLITDGKTSRRAE